jgi:membrane-associated protease RseP (regulator of RpoE activity)
MLSSLSDVALGQAPQQQKASVVVLSDEPGNSEKLLDELREKLKFLPEDQRNKIIDQVEKSLDQAAKSGAKQQRTVVATVDAKDVQATKDGQTITMTIVQSSDENDSKKGEKKDGVVRIEKMQRIVDGTIPEELKKVLGNNMILEGGLMKTAQDPKFRIGLSVENPEETESEDGLLVDRVMEDSPAAQAGVQEGDVIIEINGEEAEDFASLQEAVQEAGKSDRALKLKLQRDGKEMVLKVKTTRSEEPTAMNFKVMPRVGSILPLEMIQGGEGQAMGFAIQTPNDPMETKKEIAELKEEIQELKAMVKKLLESNDKR